jgi:hypothetical protein
MAEDLSIVRLSSEARIFLEYQSMTAVRYTNPSPSRM